MLVGPTGGGKTTVRRILERALILLPVEDVLSPEEEVPISQVSKCSTNTVLLCRLGSYFVLSYILHSLHISCSVLIKVIARIL